MLWPIKAPQDPNAEGPQDPESVAAVIRELRGDAPEALDTFGEVAQKLTEIENKDPGDLAQLFRDRTR